VIAGNGMCSGGRIVNYLKAMLGDPRHEVVFVGYQAKGTPGAVIQASEGAEGVVQVDLDGEMFEVRLKIMPLGGYSSHADQGGLVRFALGGHPRGRRVVLVHGVSHAKSALAAVLKKESQKEGGEVNVIIP